MLGIVHCVPGIESAFGFGCECVGWRQSIFQPLVYHVLQLPDNRVISCGRLGRMEGHVHELLHFDTLLLVDLVQRPHW